MRHKHQAAAVEFVQRLYQRFLTDDAVLNESPWKSRERILCRRNSHSSLSHYLVNARRAQLLVSLLSLLPKETVNNVVLLL